MNNIFKVAAFTLQEAFAKKLILALLILTVVFLGLYFYGAHALQENLTERAAELGRERLRRADEIYATLSIMGLYVVNFLGSLVGIMLGVSTLSGEVESGLLMTILIKPLRRAELVLGKWLGLSLVSLVYLALLGLGVVYGTYWITGYLPADYLKTILLMALGTWILLTSTVLCSAVFPVLTSGVVMFMVYALSWTGGLVGNLGKFTDTPLMEKIGLYSHYIFPSDAMWRFASYYLQTRTMRDLPPGIRDGNPLVGSTEVQSGDLVWAFFYLVALLGLAIVVFRRRDL
ncbi:ABC transporter permease [Deinococcus roseus]|uniref:ABC transporter permease n=1 Tax=Deinococcus roseus TaxID=392414 RepID=A0ABQ2D1C4_9DEIO|nr:ABC transporter permease subunit [Deinococcus roseus]GGJ38323.1 hypothetical protein GCM10008938_25550 [Deinococcus roseus]